MPGSQHAVRKSDAITNRNNTAAKRGKAGLMLTNKYGALEKQKFRSDKSFKTNNLENQLLRCLEFP